MEDFIKDLLVHVGCVSPCCPPLSPHYQGGGGCRECPQSLCRSACHHQRANTETELSGVD